MKYGEKKINFGRNLGKMFVISKTGPFHLQWSYFYKFSYSEDAKRKLKHKGEK